MLAQAFLAVMRAHAAALGTGAAERAETGQLDFPTGRTRCVCGQD